MSEILSIATEQVGEVFVIRLRGELNSGTADVLREQMRSVRDNGQLFVRIDLAEVEFMDSTGLGVIVAGHKRCSQNGGELTIRVTSDRMMKPFRMTGLVKVLVFSDEDGGLLPDSQ